MAEKIKLDEDLAQELAFDEAEDYRLVSEREHPDRRWMKAVTTTVRRVADDKLFSFTWDRALTELGEHEFYGCELVEVERKTKTVEVVYYEEVAA